MEVLFHGTWRAYHPRRPSPDAPPGTIYAKRDKDGTDWYHFAKTHKTNPNSGVFVAMFQHGIWIVGAATRDIKRLYPSGQALFEITDYGGGDPARELVGKVYDPDAKTFTKFSEDMLRT